MDKLNAMSGTKITKENVSSQNVGHQISLCFIPFIFFIFTVGCTSTGTMHFYSPSADTGNVGQFEYLRGSGGGVAVLASRNGEPNYIEFKTEYSDINVSVQNEWFSTTTAGCILPVVPLPSNKYEKQDMGRLLEISLRFYNMTEDISIIGNKITVTFPDSAEKVSPIKWRISFGPWTKVSPNSYTAERETVLKFKRVNFLFNRPINEINEFDLFIEGLHVQNNQILIPVIHFNKTKDVIVRFMNL